MYPIADLHCDLLSYLAQDEKRTIYDESSRCALPQFKKGNVVFQTLAIYTETSVYSVASAEKQFAIFCQLEERYPSAFERVSALKIPQKSSKIHIAAAIENASGLCDEIEPLDNCFKRLDRHCKTAGPLLYISLTWNSENRFGGGNHSKVGLKRDGELMLDYLSGKKIAIDLSHTSDALAEDILDYIEKKSLQLVPIASHSNFRSICNQPRNLTDRIAKEIVKRGGVIGLNFFRPFVGDNCPQDFKNQLEYANTLKCMDHTCLGADFFYDKDFMSFSYSVPFFYEPFGNASCYQELMSYFKTHSPSQDFEKIAYKNLNEFFERL